MGIVVFDIDDGYKFVRRIPTWDAPAAGPGGGERQGHRGQRQDRASSMSARSSASARSTS